MDIQENSYDHTWHRVAVVLLIVTACVLAVTSLVGDSLTFDELNHLTAGMSYLKTGDFRLAPETPPLAQVWAALPLLLMEHDWPPPQTPGWREGAIWMMGRAWLFDLNDGEHLLTVARCMIVVLLAAVCLCTYAIGRMLFGPLAGLLALTLAALSPTYLAHGRLVTTDMPVTLAFLAVLLTFSGLMHRITWGRLGAACVAMAALTLVKFSWPLVLPALLAMAVIAVVRRAPIECPILGEALTDRDEEKRVSVRLVDRGRRTAGVVGIFAIMFLTSWLAIWTCYGWRYGPYRGDPAMMPSDAVSNEVAGPATMTPQSWEMIQNDEHGEPMCGATPGFVRWGRSRRLLPEAYLYGMAFTHKFAQARLTYLNGAISITGWLSYFPIAFAIKTPIAIMLLTIAGLSAIACRRTAKCRDPILMTGFVTFAVVYAIVAVASRLNVGHRHLLPVYPAVMVFAGASAAWMSSRPGRRLVLGAVAWLAIANLWIHPHYLAYFNELIGGPANGHLYLVDSNIDWGQDLKRLAVYARRHPGESVKLAYLGTADPTRYGFDVGMLPSFLPLGAPAELTAGIYVASVTQLAGVYHEKVRDSFWTPEVLETYRQLHDAASKPLPEDETSLEAQRRMHMDKAYDAARRDCLLNRLRHRQPDDRIGYSLFVYHLTQADVDQLMAP